MFVYPHRWDEIAEIMGEYSLMVEKTVALAFRLAAILPVK